MRKHSQHNIRNSMNERTHFFIKNISLTLYSRKGWCWLCVRGELETGTDCYILTQSTSDHSSTWLGLLTCGSLWVASPQSASWFSRWHLVPPTDSNSNRNWPKPSVALGYIIASRVPASAVPPLIYTGASLDWRLGRGSIYNILIACSAIFFFFKTTWNCPCT